VTVLPFPTAPPPPVGNGALELVRHYFEHYRPNLAPPHAALPDGEYFLAWLANEGFIVVPISEAGT
jgi:hypothetical protein